MGNLYDLSTNSVLINLNVATDEEAELWYESCVLSVGIAYIKLTAFFLFFYSSFAFITFFYNIIFPDKF